MALPTTSDLLNAAYSAYYDGGNLPSTLRLLEVNGKPLMMRDDASGFFGAAFITDSGQVIIAFEGTDVSSFGSNPEFAAAQVFADLQIYLGQVPDAYADALSFTKKAIVAAKAQGFAAADIFLSGHSLGAAEVQYVAAQLDLAGESYGGPGIPASTIPDGQTSELVNYVEYGDPVGNYNADPNPLGDFLYSDQIVRYGSASYIGDPLDVLQLNIAAEFFGPGTTDAENAAGLAILADAAYDHHLLVHYAADLNVDLISSGTGIDALTKGQYLNILNTILTDQNAVYGGSGNDVLRGSAEPSTLRGGAGDDRMIGQGGDDRMFGNSGADHLVGRAGHDLLKGGGGGDAFMFRALSHSSTAPDGRDMIRDFSAAQNDRIDLRAIDADTTRAGNQSFDLIGDDAFGGNGGELQVIDVSDARTLVRADVDADGRADFAILLRGSVSLQADDFVL